MLKRSKPPPPEAELQRQRQQQLEGFLRLNSAARPINSEASAYEVPISTIYGRLSLYVHFPPSFPSTPPVVQVTQLVQHPWVDDKMYVVHHPRVVQWKDGQQGNAGELVRDIVNEWTRVPPVPVSVKEVRNGSVAAAGDGKEREKSEADWVLVGRGSTGASAASSPMSVSPKDGGAAGLLSPSSMHPPLMQQISSLSSSSASSFSSPSSSSSSSAPAASTLSLPVPSSFPFLTSASVSELIAMESDPDLLMSNLMSLPSSVHIAHIKDDMSASLADAASASLSLRSQYEQQRDGVMQLRQKVKEEQEAVAALARRQAEVVSRWSAERVLRELSEAAEEADRKSEKLRERYMEGGREEQKAVVAGGAKAEEADGQQALAAGEEEKDSARRGDAHSRFLDSFIKQRTLVHQRMAKKERLIEAMQSAQLQHRQSVHGAAAALQLPILPR